MLFVFVGIEDVAHGADGVEVRRRHRTAEDERVGTNLEQFLEFRGAADEAAEAGESLGERADDQRVVVIAQCVQHGASALAAHDGGGVRVIDIEDGVALKADLVERRQRRKAPVML